MEVKFPVFLRDMIESVRSGIPLHKALLMSSKLDYGKLSEQVKKTAYQISWGMPFDKAISQFADRVKKSKRIYTALRTIRESYTSGGDIVSILESISETVTMLGESEKEKRSVLLPNFCT